MKRATAVNPPDAGLTDKTSSTEPLVYCVGFAGTPNAGRKIGDGFRIILLSRPRRRYDAGRGKVSLRHGVYSLQAVNSLAPVER
jgi:hypothetical protein